MTPLMRRHMLKKWIWNEDMSHGFIYIEYKIRQNHLCQFWCEEKKQKKKKKLVSSLKEIRRQGWV